MTNNTGPARVQIQTQSVCNGRCIFCPYKDVLDTDLPQGRMEPELFHKIIDELAELTPRRISPYLMNEPLLDPRLPDFIHYIADRIPKATTLVTTNGACLDEARASALIDSGLKRVKVSLQSLNGDVNRELMGPACDSDKIIENVLRMKRLMKEKRAKKFDLRVSMIVTNANLAEIEEARTFWKKNGIRLVTSVLENRGGNIKDAQALNPHEMACVEGDCIRPSREMCILFNGDVVLCCVDWYRTVVLGNVGEESIADIWNGERVRAIRNALREDDHAALPEICVNCTESAQPDHHRRSIGKRLARWMGFGQRSTCACGQPGGNTNHAC